MSENQNSDSVNPKMTSEEEEAEFNRITVYIDGILVISMVLSVLVPLLVLIVGFYKRNLIDRVSLRFQAAISIVGFISALTNYIASDGWSNTTCTFIGYFNLMVTPLYCFLNIAIAVNLQLILIHKLQPKKYWEYIYWGVIVVLVGVISIPLLALDYLGSDDPLTFNCFVKKSTPNRQHLIAGLNAYPVIITLVYCLIVTVLVIIKINKGIELLEKYHAFSTENTLKKSLKLENYLKRLISRIALYPIVFVIANIGLVFKVLGALFKEGGVFELNLWAEFGIASTGWLNFVSFILDPTFQNSFKSLLFDIKKRCSNSKPGDIELVQKNSPGTDYEEIVTQGSFVEEEALEISALF